MRRARSLARQTSKGDFVEGRDDESGGIGDDGRGEVDRREGERSVGGREDRVRRPDEEGAREREEGVEREGVGEGATGGSRAAEKPILEMAGMAMALTSAERDAEMEAREPTEGTAYAAAIEKEMIT